MLDHPQSGGGAPCQRPVSRSCISAGWSRHGPTAAVFARPAHPYTPALLAATPMPDPRAAPRRGRAAGRDPEPRAAAPSLRVPHPLPVRAGRAAGPRPRRCARSPRASSPPATSRFRRRSADRRRRPLESAPVISPRQARGRVALPRRGLRPGMAGSICACKPLGLCTPEPAQSAIPRTGAKRHAMTQRIEAGGLRVAKALYDFIKDEALPGTGVDLERFWSALADIIHELAPRNRALLAQRDELQARIDAWHREQRGRRIDPAAYKAFLGEIGYLLPGGRGLHRRHDQRRPRDQHHRRPAAGGAGDQRALRAERRQCALGQPLRCALRHRRDPRGRRRRARQRPTTRCAARRVIAFARDFLDRIAPLARRLPPRRDGLCRSRTAGWRSRSWAAASPGSPSPSKFAGYQGDAARPSVVLLVNHGLHVEVRIDRAHPIGRTDAAGVADLVLEAAITTIHGLRGFGRRGRCRGQGPGLSQLARPDDGRPRHELREGRQDRRAPPRPGSDLHRPRRRAAHPAGPQPDAGAQRRPPHDQRRGARPGRRSGARGHPRRHDHEPDRAARPAGARALSQQPGGLGLHRQAEDARARRGRLRRRAVRPHRGCARPRAASPSRWASWTRSGAPRSTSRSASAPPRTASSSSTPASSTAPATRSTPRWKPAR